MKKEIVDIDIFASRFATDINRILDPFRDPRSRRAQRLLDAKENLSEADRANLATAFSSLSERFRVWADRLRLSVSLLIITLLFCASGVSAQTNIHVAGSIGASGNLGFQNPIVGVDIGGDYRHKQIGLSGDLSLDRIEKNVGGKGYQLTGRETMRLFKDRFFVQGGASESHYKVVRFSKSSFAPLGGLGYATDKTIIEGNFLADITSPNRARIFEGRVTFFLKHHVFLRFAASVDNFRQGKQRMTGAATRAEIGAWKQ